ncbi:MAG: cation transporter [Gemmataceae bacterium]|nr:cation transporter [Gemmataceae bacterium]
MSKKLIACVAVLAALVGGAAWALRPAAKAGGCCFEGSPCCFPGSPCCEAAGDCCYPGSPCCYEGSPCCEGGCCAEGASCCKEGAACCAAKKAVPVAAKAGCCAEGAECCFPGSPCCEGAGDCCFEGSPCCFPGSPCCEGAGGCCFEGSPCCFPGSPCCSATLVSAETPKSDKPVAKGKGCCGKCAVKADVPAAKPAAGATVIAVEGMDCPSCAKKIVAKLSAVAGVAKVAADAKASRLTVTPKDKAAPSAKAMWEAVVAAGFKPTSLEGPAGKFAAQPKE